MEPRAGTWLGVRLEVWLGVRLEVWLGVWLGMVRCVVVGGHPG